MTHSFQAYLPTKNYLGGFSKRKPGQITILVRVWERVRCSAKCNVACGIEGTMKDFLCQ